MRVATLTGAEEQAEFAKGLMADKKRKHRPLGVCAKKSEKCVRSVPKYGIIVVPPNKPPTSKTETHMRKYIINRRPGQHLTYEDRIILARTWNPSVNGEGKRFSIRSFAKAMGIATETWRRELRRGATSTLVKQGFYGNKSRKFRYDYPEYDPDLAQQSIADGNANKGTGMVITNILARRFKVLVLEYKLSPYCAQMKLREEFPRTRVPSLRTWYNHIDVGDIGVHYGETPYHPGKRRKRPFAHPAHCVPGHRKMTDRPIEANERKPGHYEMDTVVSGVGGKGGVLVLQERNSRQYIIEKIKHINQSCILKALVRMIKRGAISEMLSLTTDNGTEFAYQEPIESIVKCKVYYTRAYASYEKGSIENCNRILRRWFPKKTNFNLITRSEIQAVEDIINSMPRMLLKGLSANAYKASIA